MASALYKKKCYSKEKYLSEICYTTVKTGSMKSNIISEKKWYMTLFLFFSTHFDFSLTWPTTCFYYTWFYFIPARPVALTSLLKQITWWAAGLSPPKVDRDHILFSVSNLFFLIMNFMGIFAWVTFLWKDVNSINHNQ